MSVETVHRYYQLVDQGDVPALVSLFTPDATYHRPGYEPLVGHEGLTRFYGQDRVIKEGAHTVSTVVADDGREVGLRFADFFTVTAEGRFSRRDTFFFAPLV